MRKAKTLLVAIVAIMAMATSVSAWPAPGVMGDCDGWYVTETATDKDWKHTAYWTIDGVEGQFARGETVFVPDDSDATERSFMVRWLNADGKELDAREGKGTRDLSGCEPPVELVFAVIPPAPACAPWQPTWGLDVPEFEGTLTAFFDEGFARELVSGQDEFVATQEPIDGESLFGVVVMTDLGEVVFEFHGSVSPLSDEECTPTTTVPEEPTTTEPPTDTTQPPAPPTTDGPAPTTPVQQGDSEQGPQGSFPVESVYVALALAGVASLAVGGRKLAALIKG